MLLAQRRLLRSIDRERVKKAIQEAERLTSGEIRVSVAPFFWGNLRAAAERAFSRLGMTATRDRNGILLFIVPSRRRFVVLGDEGIHAKVGPEFWSDVAKAMSERFRAGDFTGGLVHGIDTVGRELATHFPYDAATDVNELPDDIDFGGKN
ncbi:MAG TPA: TPM domain-containing protein [Vicinamibacteria bacterium]|nr:TPM domain-containing protein [Vicinamibacteria bacterium]